MEPPINGLSHMWHTPIRHDHLTGTSHDSASSNRLPNDEFHATVRPLRAKATEGPESGTGGVNGGCGAGREDLAIPGVIDSPGPKVSL